MSAIFSFGRKHTWICKNCGKTAKAWLYGFPTCPTDQSRMIRIRAGKEKAILEYKEEDRPKILSIEVITFGSDRTVEVVYGNK
jgi:hypothetical protein